MNSYYSHIPRPFQYDSFELYKVGIFGNEEVNVYINHQKTFAFLYPPPLINYSKYTPRVKKLNLQDYKKHLKVIEERFNKISFLFKRLKTNERISYLEIGAGDGAFAKTVKINYPQVDVTLVEPNLNSKVLREKVENVRCFKDLDDICNRDNEKYDIICLFHVLEHIMNPIEFLEKIHGLMDSDSLLVVEVPSLKDPLLFLYSSEEYSKFYFQPQHPYVYSDESIGLLMKHMRFTKHDILYHQRYGIENHLNWLIHKKPGGNIIYRNIFNTANEAYIKDLELHGTTDSVIYIGKSGIGATQ